MLSSKTIPLKRYEVFRKLSKTITNLRKNSL